MTYIKLPRYHYEAHHCSYKTLKIQTNEIARRRRAACRVGHRGSITCIGVRDKASTSGTLSRVADKKAYIAVYRMDGCCTVGYMRYPNLPESDSSCSPIVLLIYSEGRRHPSAVIMCHRHGVVNKQIANIQYSGVRIGVRGLSASASIGSTVGPRPQVCCHYESADLPRPQLYCDYTHGYAKSRTQYTCKRAK